MNQTQTQKVLKHLQTQTHGLTSLEAVQLYHATRLSAIIFCLRKRGYNIITIDEECVHDDGTKSRYARYFLKEQKNGD